MEDLTEEQKDALDALPEEAKEKVMKMFRESNRMIRESNRMIRESNRISRGQFFHPFTAFLQPKKESFEGGYREFCKRMNNRSWEDKRPKRYSECVDKVTKFVKGESDDISMASFHSKVSDASSTSRVDSTSTGGKERNRLHGTMKDKAAKKIYAERKVSIFGGVDSNRAHLLAQKNTECAPLQGILGPAILGFDLVGICSYPGRLIQAFQATAICSSGLCDSLHNSIRLPMGGHQLYFDSDDWPAWFVLPVKDLDEAAEFDPTEPYWVIPLAGLLGILDGDEVYAQNLKTHKRECLRTLYGQHDYREHPETQKLAEPKEIKKAIAFLVACIKALADVVTGLPTGPPGTEKLMPIELDRTEGKSLSQEKKDMMEKTCKSLVKDKTVWIPDFIEDVDLVDMKVLKVLLRPGVVPLPDPMLLGVKSAFNWMAQNGQKPLPACPNLDSSDDQDEEDEEAWYANDTPSTPACVPEAVFFPTTVTPSPARDRPAEGDSGLESDLDSESDFQDAS